MRTETRSCSLKKAWHIFARLSAPAQSSHHGRAEGVEPEVVVNPALRLPGLAGRTLGPPVVSGGAEWALLPQAADC